MYWIQGQERAAADIKDASLTRRTPHKIVCRRHTGRTLGQDENH